jgi:hypothetical protein
MNGEKIGSQTTVPSNVVAISGRAPDRDIRRTIITMRISRYDGDIRPRTDLGWQSQDGVADAGISGGGQ